MSEPGENAIRIDWRLEERERESKGEKDGKRMGKRGTEIWGGGGEKHKGGGRVGAETWGKNSMEHGSKLGVVGIGVCSPRNKLAQSSFKLIFQII